MSDWEEPGRSVADDGRIVYAWPPEGRFVEMWEHISLSFSDEEKSELLALLTKWRDENSTLAALTNDAGVWVDVEPTWSDVYGWLEP